jgi:hypothetical protein
MQAPCIRISKRASSFFVIIQTPRQKPTKLVKKDVH